MAGVTELEDAIARKDAVIGPTDRSFGITFAVVFAVIAAFPLVHGGFVRLWALAVAAALAAIALLKPAILAPANRWWLRFGLLLHRIVNPLILGLMFFLVITPIGVLMRLFGKQSLGTGFDPGAASYWVKREPPGPEPKTMRRQF